MLKNCSNDVSTVEKPSRHTKNTENLVGPGVGGGPTLGTHTIVEFKNEVSDVCPTRNLCVFSELPKKSEGNQGAVS